MLQRELDSLLWKINYKDISWARTNPLPSLDEAEVGVVKIVCLYFAWSVSEAKNKIRKNTVVQVPTENFYLVGWHVPTFLFNFLLQAVQLNNDEKVEVLN